MYDYLIVGSGLFGATFAYEVSRIHKKVLVLDRRKNVGGNVYCEAVEGINVHKFGPHIFHTNNEDIWNFVNKFVRFNRFTYSPLANYKGNLYNLPFNMNTFYQMWGIKSPEEVKSIIQNQVNSSGIIVPDNLEEQAISLVGKDIYEILIKEYTEKQWGRPARELPAFIIKRLPVRFTFDNNYFNDKFQGIPEGGYNLLVASLLRGIEVRLNVNFLDDRGYWESIAKKIVFTGPLDELFGYEDGALEYRSLRFEEQILSTENYQGVAVMNFTGKEVPYTRIIEHKHFEFNKGPNTVITKEFPMNWFKGSEPYYPINNKANEALHRKYKRKSDRLKNYIFGGRLADYQYYDMHQVIGSALSLAKKEILQSDDNSYD
ncbi:UDP-galactopyranose mutase [Emticicia sp. 21SJ11W-3]|uniref:UDP-galactopyranose mutase n=1 Tax=Emticicia sp. 21SJ11W-3 TaxID=2916755 RepID=UPI0020A04C7F|nr:UDP-galactopyranose mutase [Emticicia sp. 21SJ11W-3]UTA69108.1 UDP-galactopyranose mutase [Emticicia sp. 21SJ11W-3]